MRKTLFPLAVVGGLLALCACESDLTSSVKSVSVTVTVDSVKNIYSLGNCTKDREGQLRYVLGESAYFVCSDENWVETELSVDQDRREDTGVVDTVKSIYSLGACSAGREGKVSFVEKENGYYRCSDESWSRTLFDAEKTDFPNKENVSDLTEDDNPEHSGEENLGTEDDTEPVAETEPETGSDDGEGSSNSSESTLKKNYDCSVYDCVTTEFLNKEMLETGKYGQLLDTRDSQVYRTIAIGTQVWMAQNLNYQTMGSRCFDGTTENCETYGRLYLQKDAQNVCPSGWHLPSNDEWNVLNDYVDGKNGSAGVGNSLKSLTWTNGERGTDQFGFSGVAGRFFGDVLYCGSYTHGLFWTSDANEYRCLLSDDPILYYYKDTSSDDWGMSVRCLKNKVNSSSSVAQPSSSEDSSKKHYDCSVYKCFTTEYLNQELLAAGKYGELLDVRDSQVYRTVTIGSQTWMAQNLNYSKTGTTYCYDDNDTYCSKYGRLYIRAAVSCPSGWHLPDDSEWGLLFKNVGGQSIAANALRSSTGWDKHPNLNSPDKYGFSSLPGGVYYFGDEGGTGWYLSATGYNDFSVGTGAESVQSTAADYTAISVRCLKD